MSGRTQKKREFIQNFVVSIAYHQKYIVSNGIHSLLSFFVLQHCNKAKVEWVDEKQFILNRSKPNNLG